MNTLRDRYRAWLALGALGALGWLGGCHTPGTACAKRGAVDACPCPGGKQGTRTCLPERIFSACACGAKQDGGAAGAAGSAGSASMQDAGHATGGGAPAATGGSSGGGAGASASAGSGVGGSAGENGTAGSAGQASSTAGAGGASAGAGGNGAGAGANAGAAASDKNAYGKCNNPNACARASSNCATIDADPLLGSPAGSVCQPPCTMPSDCPVPAGSYSAKVMCNSDGFCTLDCTGENGFPPTPATCPGGMQCIGTSLTGSHCFN